MPQISYLLIIQVCREKPKIYLLRDFSNGPAAGPFLQHSSEFLNFKVSEKAIFIN